MFTQNDLISKIDDFGLKRDLLEGTKIKKNRTVICFTFKITVHFYVFFSFLDIHLLSFLNRVDQALQDPKII